MPNQNQSLTLEQFLPKIQGLVESKVEREITLAFTNLYNYFSREIKNLQDIIEKNISGVQFQLEEKKIIPLEELDSRILTTKETLKKTTAGAPFVNDGFIIVEDNAGNSTKLMTTA